MSTFCPAIAREDMQVNRNIGGNYQITVAGQEPKFCELQEVHEWVSGGFSELFKTPVFGDNSRLLSISKMPLFLHLADGYRRGVGIEEVHPKAIEFDKERETQIRWNVHLQSLKTRARGFARAGCKRYTFWRTGSLPNG